ncbi:GerAB/ArcD/ProY family transporter [Brevibacillus sp. TJ4]|uniref:GerAB/ArcD/ProY family transporter n=1 Tax=Brevibacillus sp. TJ4 TaxID=3234853 RepID=UPI0037CF07EB
MPVLSTIQLWSLVFLFQMGSNLVFGFGAGAKQDAWIAAAISAMIGCLLVWMYSKLAEFHPDLNWVPLLENVFGSFLGKSLSMLYILGFLYGAGRMLRDCGELLHTYILPRTPLEITMLLLLSVITYCCFAGIERMARLAEIYMLILFLFLGIQFLFLFSSGVMRFSLLQPVAVDWLRIAKTVFPLGVTVPFGETLAFSMFWVWMVRADAYRKGLLRASLVSGLLFAILDLITVATLGPELFSTAFFPLVTTFQFISVGDFIENLDPLVVSNLLITGTFKIYVFIYAACTGIVQQCKIQSHRSVIMPATILVLLLAVFMAKDIANHLFTGLQWVPWLLWVPLFIVFPFIALLLSWIKKNLFREGAKQHESQNE